ncbi:MAG: formyltransferase family protein [Sedimentisphaerales bacterium]|nr:formyltransferase family protein [Sedimentisphaerales bacterium]
MERSKKIVYLCTENNAKSYLGLEEILKDEWNVVLVIAYVHTTQEMARKSLCKRLWQTLVNPRRTCLRLYARLKNVLGKNKPLKLMSIAELCELHTVQYVQTTDNSLQTMKDCIAAVSPDVVLSNGWMFKITEDVFSLAGLIALNCHSSYLPEYRGGNVTYAPLINEERQSGVTVHRLVKQFDAGLILAQERVNIEPGDSPESLITKRAQITGSVLIRALETVGHEELYKENSPSPFYFRCTYKTYRRFKRINFLRKIIGLPIKRYEPKERFDI